MFDRLPAMVHHLGSGSKPIRHPLHNGLVLVAGDGPISACGAWTAQSTARTVGVVNHVRFAPCFADAGAPYRNQTCARGTGISIRFGIVPERRLRKLTTAPSFAPVRLQNIRRDPRNLTVLTALMQVTYTAISSHPYRSSSRHIRTNSRNTSRNA